MHIFSLFASSMSALRFALHSLEVKFVKTLSAKFPGDLSRNRTVGIRLGKGEQLKDIIDSMKAVAEGVLTSKSTHQLAKYAVSVYGPA